MSADRPMPMSADRPRPDGAALESDRARASGFDPTDRTSRRDLHASGLHTAVARTEPPLSIRIERTRLRLQVAALERALATSERRRQHVIDRYERLLEGNRESRDEDRPADDQSSGSGLLPF